MGETVRRKKRAVSEGGGGEMRKRDMRLVQDKIVIQTIMRMGGRGPERTEGEIQSDWLMGNKASKFGSKMTTVRDVYIENAMYISSM